MACSCRHYPVYHGADSSGSYTPEQVFQTIHSPSYCTQTFPPCDLYGTGPSNPSHGSWSSAPSPGSSSWRQQTDFPSKQQTILLWWRKLFRRRKFLRRRQTFRRRRRWYEPRRRCRKTWKIVIPHPFITDKNTKSSLPEGSCSFLYFYEITHRYGSEYMPAPLLFRFPARWTVLQTAGPLPAS